MNTKKHISNVIAIAITSALFIPAALAGGSDGQAHKAKKRHSPQALLAKFDRNRDGTLDRSELRAMRAHQKMRKKMRKKKHKQKQELLQRFDRNRDGRLDVREKRAAMRFTANQRYDKLLSRNDRNGDGALTWRELGKAMRRGQPGQMSEFKRNKAKKLRKLFIAADRNGDKVLTRAEFRAEVMAQYRARKGPGNLQRHRAPYAAGGNAGPVT